MAKDTKIQFLVIKCSSIYQCIFGRPTLDELITVPSTVHLKMKYYTAKGHVATLHGDIEATRRCFEASSKGLNSIKVTPQLEAILTLPVSSEVLKSLLRIDIVDLDNRFCREAEGRMEENFNKKSRRHYAPHPR